MPMTYDVEYTDTFGGEANYCWVTRLKVEAVSPLAAVRRVKRELGISGVRCRREDYGDSIALYPYGFCSVIFINEAD